jgi:RNA polymerase sigma-70 factor (ECF subfamily)
MLKVDAAASKRVSVDAAFGAFYRDAYPRLYGAIVLSTRDVGVAEDIAQETFVRVWRDWSRVSGLEKPEGYTFKIAFNLLRDNRRKASRWRSRVVLTAARATSSDPDRAGRMTVEAAILRLPTRQRAALILTSVFGYSSPEAAEILGIRAGTIRRLVGKARESIQQSLSEGGSP